MEEIELGDRVQDRISKQKGIIIGVTEWLYGCVRVTIQPEEVKDGKPVEGFSIDLPQCELLKKGVVTPQEKLDEVPKEKKAKGPGGPRSNASRGHETNPRRN